MKIIKARIHRVTKPAPGQGRMGYPTGYNNDDVIGQGVGPGAFQNGTGAYSGGIGRGQDEEWCLFLIPDALANQYVLDADMEIVSEATADALMEQWRIDNNETETVVTDPDRVQTIYAKQEAGTGMTPEEKTAAGLDLTQEEQDILDPDNPLPGINKRLRLVADIVADTGKSLTP
jgi:hypothetical protein